MTFQTVTPPAAEILAFDDVHQQLSKEADETYDQALIESLIASARDRAETYTRRRFITQTVRLTRDGFGRGFSCPIGLPIAPIASVDKVDYLDGAGDWQTVAASDYRLITSCEPYELVPAYGKSWPVPRIERANVRIDLVVGYGADHSFVPPTILQAIRFMVAHMYRYREDRAPGGDTSSLFGTEGMLDPHRIWI